MSCNYILKNGNICKNTAKKSIKILDYCTRHYNILIQNSNTTPDNIDNILSELNLETDVTFINKGAFGSVYKISLDNKDYALKIQYLTYFKNGSWPNKVFIVCLHFPFIFSNSVPLVA